MNGILVGTDKTQEWLLPWWWERYSAHNTLPVAFVDFGMSDEARQWCEARGQCLDAPAPFALTPHTHFAEDKRRRWEARCGDSIWHFRAAWFRKPTAFQRTPFDITCWLDLDCEVRCNLSSLFGELDDADLAMAPEPAYVQQKDDAYGFLLPGEVSYNSGVVVFRKGAKILREWVELARGCNELFISDQNALSRAIYLHEPPFKELSAQWNWSPSVGESPEARIVHFHGPWKLQLFNAPKGTAALAAAHRSRHS